MGKQEMIELMACNVKLPDGMDTQCLYSLHVLQKSAASFLVGTMPCPSKASLQRDKKFDKYTVTNRIKSVTIYSNRRNLCMNYVISITYGVCYTVITTEVNLEKFPAN